MFTSKVIDFGEHFSENYNKYFRYAFSISGDKFLSEDLVMEVLEQMIRKFSDMEFDGELEGYIIRSIKNRYLNVVKSSLNREIVPIESELQIADESLKSSSLGELEDLVTKLQEVGELCRGVLTLFGLGYSYREIAEIEEIKIGTVMNRMSTCRERLALEYQL